MQWRDTGNWDLSIGGSSIQGTDQEQELNLSLTSSALFYTAQGGYNFQGFANHDASYRWQVTKEFMVTPDLQIIMGEGLESGEAISNSGGFEGV